MIDLHMHLIPGVDDGAADLEMSLAMLDQARQQGITRIFATPHSSAFCDDRLNVPLLFQELKAAAAVTHPDIPLHLGCEVYCTPWNMPQLLQELDTGRYPTVNGGSHVLVEFPSYVYPEEPLPCIEALVRGGYQPIIAHLERYKELRDHMELVEQLREAGARIQLNAYSLACERVDAIRNWARRLILEKKADFLGTDAHRTGHRPPLAAEGLQWLYASTDQSYADAVAHENARQLLL